MRGVLRMLENDEFHVPGESSVAAMNLLTERFRLVLLRGIGTNNARRLDAAGVRTIADLAERDPVELTDALRGVDERGWWPRSRRVRVWVEAARRATR